MVGAKARAAAGALGFGEDGAVRAGLYEGQRRGVHAIRAHQGGGGLSGVVSVPDTRWRKETRLTRRAHLSAKEGAGPVASETDEREGVWAAAPVLRLGQLAGHGRGKAERGGWAYGELGQHQAHAGTEGERGVEALAGWASRPR